MVAPEMRAIGPSAARKAPGSAGSNGISSASANCLDARGHRGGHGHREPVIADPGDGPSQFRDCVVIVEHRSVPRGPFGLEPHPRQALLSGLHQVQTQVVAHSDRESTHLADRFGDSGEHVGTVLHDPVGTVPPTGLFVGGHASARCPAAAHSLSATSPARARSTSRPCPSCRPPRGPRSARRSLRRRTVAPTSRQPSPAPHPGARAATRHCAPDPDRGCARTRPGGWPTSSRTARPSTRTLASTLSTNSAATPRPRSQSGSPVLVVSIRIRLAQDRTASSWASVIEPGGAGCGSRPWAHPASPRRRMRHRSAVDDAGRSPAAALLFFLSSRPGGGIGRRASLRC